MGHGGVGLRPDDGRGGLLIFLVHEAVHRQLWPFRSWPALYASQAMIPVAAVLVVLLVLTNLQDGVVYRQTWLPLVNPLEEGAALRYWDSLYFIAFRSAFSRCRFRYAVLAAHCTAGA